MQNRLLIRSLLLFLITTCLFLTSQQADNNEKNSSNTRLKRGGIIVYKPGFIRTLFSVIYEQWADTKNTFNKVNQMINDNFLPENAPQIETTTNSDPNATTTMAPYRISRSEFYRIVRRNLRGLNRLYNIEFQDAARQSNRYSAEFKKNLSMEISKFL